MPELPEVETSRRGIEPFLKDQMIEAIEIHQGSLRWPVSEHLYTLGNEAIHAVSRRGKYILIHLSEGSILLHLGMSGSVRIVSPDCARQKHDHVDFRLSNGKLLRFNDPRRFGCILWTEAWQQHPLLASLGPEPLESEFTAEYLYQQAAAKKVAVKQFIMNSQVVVGVGNIYANEALFAAGIHPLRAAGRISLKRYRVLVDEIKTVLSRSIRQGGTTLKDFVGGDGKPGYFKQQLNVYGRAGEECLSCGHELSEIRQSSRSSVYCSHCQK